MTPSINLTQKLALIQRNQSLIDQLTTNNTELMNGIIMENTLSNLASVPGLPPQLAAMIRQVMNGTPISLPEPRQLMPAPDHSSNGHRPIKRTYTRKKVPAAKVVLIETPTETPRKKAAAKPHGFYDNLVIDFAKKHNGRLSLKKFREQSIGKKGVPDTFFKTTMYTKVTSMTQGPKPVLKKVDAGEYDLVHTR